MNRAAKVVVGVVAAGAAWESFWYVRRYLRRKQLFDLATAWAKHLNRPLVVIGAPDGGVTSGYGCGDITVDPNGSACPDAQTWDITKPTPLATNSVVVFCSCVLEYVTDPNAALAEIRRVSGGYAFFVTVEPWTLTAYFYPGAKQTLSLPSQ